MLKNNDLQPDDLLSFGTDVFVLDVGARYVGQTAKIVGISVFTDVSHVEFGDKMTLMCHKSGLKIVKYLNRAHRRQKHKDTLYSSLNSRK